MASILTNTSSMVALQTLKSINKGMAKVQNEISTGLQGRDRQGQQPRPGRSPRR